MGTGYVCHLDRWETAEVGPCGWHRMGPTGWVSVQGWAMHMGCGPALCPMSLHPWLHLSHDEMIVEGSMSVLSILSTHSMPPFVLWVSQVPGQGGWSPGCVYQQTAVTSTLWSPGNGEWVARLEAGEVPCLVPGEWSLPLS